MKIFFQVLAIVLVAILVKTTYYFQAMAGFREIAQVQSTEAQKPIPVSLPTTVDLLLNDKDGSSVTGQIMAFDSKSQVITVSNSGVSESFQISEIQQMAFRRDALVYDSSGEIVIRGDDTADAKQSVWSDIPLNALQLIEPETGKAEVTLAGVMKPLQLLGIRAVANNSILVVDKIQFQPGGKMTIKVTPIDR